MKRCGFVSVLGETNAGKSTFVNRIVGRKISIVSRKVQTTLNRILGVVVFGESQIVLIDTPGFATRCRSLEIEKTAWEAFRESDNVLFIVDVNKKNFEKSEALLRKIDRNKTVSLVLNKVDLIHKPDLLKIAESFSRVRSFENIFMVSALNGSGIDDVRNYLAKTVPVGDWAFSNGEVTNLSLEEFSAEITREHIYHRVHQEIPYKCKVVTESYENGRNGSVTIYQNIFVQTLAHKMVLVGHDGAKIKAIGEASRRELSNLFEKKVHLFLNVAIEKH